MDILAAMDRFVRMTRLGRCAGIDLPPPRNLRWLPVGAVAAILAGYPMIVLPDNAGRPDRRAIALMIAGMLLFVGGIVLGHFLRLLGPRLAIEAGAHPLDEREMMLRRAPAPPPEPS